ncbi:MAG TPA: succinate dehydrogenase [Stellaceae bacterium]|nr:succinate dehydrogenase [Stellaceae bacterium]
MSWRARNHPSYWAFLLHRVSGLLLAVFLPFHFWALSTAITGTARLDAFLDWTRQPLVTVAEAGLVVLLAAHLTGGLRLLALEFLAWPSWQKSAVGISAGISLAVGLLFLLNAL